MLFSKQIRRLALLLWLAAGSAVAAPPTIEIMVEDAAVPWSGPDGAGYANDLVRAAYAAVNTEVKLMVVPYARCKAYVLQGAAAACFSMSPAPDHAGKVMLADLPLFDVHPRYYYNTDKPVPALSEHTVAAGTRIGVVNGYEYPSSLAELEKRGVILDRANSESATLRKLAAGRVDLALMMSDGAKTEASQMRNVGMAFQGPTMGSYIGFSVAHPLGERARKLFNEGYRIINSNGRKAEIARRWGIR